MGDAMLIGEKDFERFKKAFMEYAHKLGLNKYRIEFEHRNLDGAYAEVETSVVEAWAVVSLTNEIVEEAARHWQGPETNALHESLHLLLSRLVHLAMTRDASAREILEEEHAIVRTLEHVLGNKLDSNNIERSAEE
jgi:hypothetical protein